MITPDGRDPIEIAKIIIEQTGVNLFLTGKAGTGKTTFLHQLASTTSKRFVILAPTGVAAINAGGATIHSFFQLDFSPYLPGKGFTGSEQRYQRFSKDKLKMIRTLDLIIIDEISMVRPDVLDAMDNTLRRLKNPLKPFGGVQLLLIGDLRQLAPVAQEEEWNLLKEYYGSPYFFESHALRQAGFRMVELTKVYRQTDEKFVGILNRIRDNIADHECLRQLNLRADMRLLNAPEEDYIRLTTHNYRANQINSSRLRALPGEEHVYEADISGDFPESAWPAESRLTLKVGAQVMFIKNDINPEKRYYNGLIGKVTALTKENVTVLPTDSTIPITTGAVVWERMKYTLNKEGNITETPEGSFSQIPLRLAWSITIHKSQGLTFDRVIVDASHSFAPGQTYVALSRCRSLAGLVLESPLPSAAIMTDPTVNAFISSGGGGVLPEEGELESFRNAYYGEMLYELFNFFQIEESVTNYHRIISSILGGRFPRHVEGIGVEIRAFRKNIMDVASRFHTALGIGIEHRHEPETARMLTEKIRSGAAYFAKHLHPVLRLVQATPMQIDNKALKKQLQNSTDSLFELLDLRISLLEAFSERDFDPGEYLKIKTRLLLKDPDKAPRPKGSLTSVAGSGHQPGTTRAGKEHLAVDIVNPELYRRLATWRQKVAGNKPLYTILPNSILMAISARMPRTKDEIIGIKGISLNRYRQFGGAIIDIVNQYIEEKRNV